MNDELPKWWPKNPYPESVFTMTEEEFVGLVLSDELRTRYLGRQFWDIASDAIYKALEANDVLKAAKYHERLVDILRLIIKCKLIADDPDAEPPITYEAFIEKVEKLHDEIERESNGN